MSIDIANAIQQRHSKRQFLDKGNKADIEQVLNWAKQAASSKCTAQEVVVLMNESRDALSKHSVKNLIKNSRNYGL